jgi:hypothetical protein
MIPAEQARTPERTRMVLHTLRRASPYLHDLAAFIAAASCVVAILMVAAGLQPVEVSQ